MAFNWRIVILLLVVAGLEVIGLSVAVHAEEQNQSLNQSYVIVGEQLSYGTPRNFTPYISQGDTVYMNDTVDISGVVPPYKYLGYWDGHDMYESNATYQIELPQQKSGYYNFYIDPVIFSERLGRWYKYDGFYEGQGNNLAFVVSPIYFDNSTLRYPNGTIVNISRGYGGEYNTTFVPPPPPVPIRHIADYLLARGDSFNLTVCQTTNLWLFGRTNELLDHASVNYSIDVSAEVLSHFEPGRYTLMTQTIRNGSSSFTVRYDNESNAIQWFDPELFKIHNEPLEGYSPQVVQAKFQQILPYAYDKFTQYHMELQEPSLEIVSIEEKLNPNETINQVGDTEYNTNTSFVLVMGYTNVAPLSPLTFILDEKQQSPRTLKSHTTIVTAEGTYGGDMRWFRAILPVDKYGLAAGEHTITGYTNLSKSPTNVNFFVYEMPEGSYVPQKTVRYIGGNEFVPTPTPVVETVTVVQTVEVVQTIEVPVTPTNEQVSEAQNRIINDLLVTAGLVVAIIAIIAGLLWYGYSVYRRAKKNQ